MRPTPTLKNVKVLTGLTEQQFDDAMMYMWEFSSVMQNVPIDAALFTL